MRFLLVRSENLVVVDNAEIEISCAALPANVEMVVYNEIDGKIEYNDRPSVRIAFTDPSPYQTLLNSWITAAAALTPALQLAQAKQVKNDLIDAIMHHKRRLPYTQGAYQFDARDDNVLALQQLVSTTASVSASSSGIVASVNTALSTITSQINAVHSTINTWSLLMANSGFAKIIQSIPIAGGGPGMMTLGELSGDPVNRSPGSGAAAIAGATVSGSTTADLSHVGNITHQPLNATSPQTIAASIVDTALQGIASRRNTLNTNKMAKQAAVNVLSTIPAIVAYDATTGWSF
jgi:hypothetical protein